MHFGNKSSRRSPDDAAYSSRAPSSEREHPHPSRYGLNAKTVAKWRNRATTADRPMGPSKPKSTVLTEIEEPIVVDFRRRTLLPLDDVLGCLRESIPKLSRSALHRCLARHGIPDCQAARRLQPSAGALPRPRSAMFISMSASCVAPKARCTCSSPSIVSRSSLKSSCIQAPPC
jgi:hypothetical protein